jgi:hypothetical protein
MGLADPSRPGQGQQTDLGVQQREEGLDFLLPANEWLKRDR